MSIYYNICCVVHKIYKWPQGVEDLKVVKEPKRLSTFDIIMEVLIYLEGTTECSGTQWYRNWAQQDKLTT